MMKEEEDKKKISNIIQEKNNSINSMGSSRTKTEKKKKKTKRRRKEPRGICTLTAPCRLLVSGSFSSVYLPSEANCRDPSLINFKLRLLNLSREYCRDTFLQSVPAFIIVTNSS